VRHGLPLSGRYGRPERDWRRRPGTLKTVSSPETSISTHQRPLAVREWVTTSGRDAELDSSDAYVLAYDAARKSVASALLISGHRVLSRPGSHQALARYAESLTAQTGEQALSRFDRLRRNRSRSDYGSRTFGKAEVKEAVDTAPSHTGSLREAGLRPPLRVVDASQNEPGAVTAPAPPRLISAAIRDAGSRVKRELRNQAGRPAGETARSRYRCRGRTCLLLVEPRLHP